MALPQTATSNSLARAFDRIGSGEVTSIDARPRDKRTHSFSPTPPAQTPASITNTMSSNIASLAEPQQMLTETPALGAAHQIDGVIADIMEESVVVQCKLTTNHIELRLPPSIVPNELLSYGTPVTITLETADGYRRPVVRARKIAEQPKLPGQTDVEQWLASL